MYRQKHESIILMIHCFNFVGRWWSFFFGHARTKRVKVNFRCISLQCWNG